MPAHARRACRLKRDASRIEGDPADGSRFPVTEFALVGGAASGRAYPSDTIFDSVGFALQDYSALRFLHQLLREERGSPRQIDLVPRLRDPKDLFGGTLGVGARARLRLTG
jgi:ornithine cyclodeaminase